MRTRYPGCFAVLICASWAFDSGPNQAAEIVRRSVANINADWAAAPKYDFTERDVITHNDNRTTKTYQVLMIEGSTYNKLIAVNDRPLPVDQAAQEDRKFHQEVERRRKESPAERQKRVGKYQNERHQDHALMTEMAKAFDFTLAGDETVNQRSCFVLNATPKAGYKPFSRETQVLKGMRGKMWVDKQEYQWVKVHAEVFRPVSFGLFFARVKPGTDFTLEQKPVDGNLWLPSHFEMNLNARVLLSSRRSTDDETYSNYHPAANVQAQAAKTSP